MKEEQYNFIKSGLHLLEVDYENGTLLNRKEYPNNKGYYMISLKHRKITTHSIIAILKYGNEVIGKEVNHLDANKKNNTPNNLELTDRSGNTKHAFELGLQVIPRMNKLTEKEVIEIKTMLKQGYKSVEIAKLFDHVNISTIGDIRQGRTWKHVII